MAEFPSHPRSKLELAIFNSKYCNLANAVDYPVSGEVLHSRPNRRFGTRTTRIDAVVLSADYFNLTHPDSTQTSQENRRLRRAGLVSLYKLKKMQRFDGVPEGDISN